MKCSKHAKCEAWWDGEGRLRHSTEEGAREGRSAAPKRQRAVKRTTGRRSRGAAKTTEARTRTTTPATQTSDVTPDTT